ncbi:MAG: replication-relaxation family protein, partial [Rhizobiaceae bacterium]|nr:replication-relaxation family protein [Rhizobiaceae bacterium]
MSPETLLRRSRFRRTPAGKRVEVTTRDIAILQWLYRYRYLSRDHLIAAIGPRSQKRFIERLGDLFHETGFIARRVPAAEPFSARATQAIYEIAAKGIEYLEQLEMLPNRAVTFSRQTKRSYNPQALHTMAIIDALLAI